MMTFGELKNIEAYIMADTISFVDTNGEEMDIDNLEDPVLEDTWVVKTHISGGHLEIVLD